LVDPRQPEGVLGALLVEVGVVDTHPPVISVLLANKDGVGEPLRMKTSMMKPTVSSLVSSFLMASCRSSAKRRRCCCLG
jgi:hypothetical protein